MIDVLIDDRSGHQGIDADRVASLCRFFQQRQGLPEEAEVSVAFVDDSEMRELNLAYRGIDRTTDVLSFECDGLDDGFPSGEDALHVMGDIVISPAKAQDQAAEHGNTFPEEVDLLVIHGLLHLCGYDHMTDEDAAVMEPLQDGLVEAWKSVGKEDRDG